MGRRPRQTPTAFPRPGFAPVEGRITKEGRTNDLAQIAAARLVSRALDPMSTERYFTVKRLYEIEHWLRNDGAAGTGADAPQAPHRVTDTAASTDVGHARFCLDMAISLSASRLSPDVSPWVIRRLLLGEPGGFVHQYRPEHALHAEGQRAYQFRISEHMERAGVIVPLALLLDELPHVVLI